MLLSLLTEATLDLSARLYLSDSRVPVLVVLAHLHPLFVEKLALFRN